MDHNTPASERCLTCTGPAAALLLHAPGAMCQVISLVQKVSQSNANVLITGETGVGKDVVARAIHAERRNRLPGIPFETVNVTAIPFELMESILFGHRKGAFTGAAQDQLGYFSTAGKGVLFLDEIGDLPIAQQPKLLRAVENREFARVGDPMKITFNGQIVSATNQNLENLVRLRSFREDLYYRLRQVHIFIPPLRTRPQDIDILLDFFIAKEAGHEQAVEFLIDRDIRERLKVYSWPGNVRQLAAIISEFHILHGKKARITHRHVDDSALFASSARADDVGKADASPTIAIHKGTEITGTDVFGVAAAIVNRLIEIHTDGSIRHSLRRAVSNLSDSVLKDETDIPVLRREIARLMRLNWSRGRLKIEMKGSLSQERQRVSAQINNTVKAILDEVIASNEMDASYDWKSNTKPKMKGVYSADESAPISIERFRESRRNTIDQSDIESIKEAIEARFATRMIVEACIENRNQWDALSRAISEIDPAAKTACTIGRMMELVVRKVAAGDAESPLETPPSDRGTALALLQHLSGSHHRGISVVANVLSAELLTIIRRDMVYVEKNVFRMGSDRNSGESPIHSVEIDGFWIDKYPVTIGQFRKYISETGNDHFAWSAATSEQDDYPVVYVSWYEAANFARWAGKELPSEAQWECAARGGLDQSLFPWGDEDPDASKVCFSTVAPAKVGRYAANGYGLYDMSGLVEEWVRDWYGPDYYASSAARNPAGPPFGTHKVTRGGAYIREAQEIRCAQRYYFAPDNFGPVTGFRCSQSEPFQVDGERFFEPNSKI